MRQTLALPPEPRLIRGEPGESASLGTLDRLQASLRERQVEVPRWAREQKAERHAAGRWLPFKSE